jgi:hypothetical protein
VIRRLSRPLALIVAAGFICLVGAVFLLWRYGGEGFFVELTAGFAAALVAFVLALEWERKREQDRLGRAAEELAKQRETEARRRFETVRRELLANLESLEFLQREFAETPRTGTMEALHPQLLHGAWTASAARLTQLISVYDLTTKLAVTYGRIEELRWRLRLRTEQRTTDLDAPTRALVGELVDEVRDLIMQVVEQIERPDVQALGVAHRITLGAAVENRVPTEFAVLDRTATSSDADLDSFWDAPIPGETPRRKRKA